MKDGKGLMILKYHNNMLMRKNKQALQYKVGRELELNIHNIFSDGKNEEKCNSFQSW